MEFYSLNRQVASVSAREAILQGLAPDGGLYMPAQIPMLAKEVLAELNSFSLPEIGIAMTRPFLEADVPLNVLEKICHDSFSFSCPLVQISEDKFVLELFHGPTLAFKDFGARFMSRLVGHFLAQEQSAATILVATSGDTGSAVASGFYKVPGTHVVLLYPRGMVSHLQEQQLSTFGENITALRVEGTFDDCQALVKRAFLDADILEHRRLLSANSINFARLLPQMVYYVKAFAEMSHVGKGLFFSVPSGNFGNLTAGVLAKRMGIDISGFIASVNRNDTFVRYCVSGAFEPKSSVATISNAMDIGNPSNFVRLSSLCNENLEAVRREIQAYSFTDEETKLAMKEVFQSCGYILDPHTAVGYLGARKSSFFGNKIILSTAHPAKFKQTVEDVLGVEIPLPEPLEQCQSKQQFVRDIPGSFTVLKDILLGV